MRKRLSLAGNYLLGWRNRLELQCARAIGLPDPLANNSIGDLSGYTTQEDRWASLRKSKRFPKEIKAHRLTRVLPARRTRSMNLAISGWISERDFCPATVNP